jgi:hypothetical protein
MVWHQRHRVALCQLCQQCTSMVEMAPATARVDLE